MKQYFCMQDKHFSSSGNNLVKRYYKRIYLLGVYVEEKVSVTSLHSQSITFPESKSATEVSRNLLFSPFYKATSMLYFFENYRNIHRRSIMHSPDFLQNDLIHAL